MDAESGLSAKAAEAIAATLAAQEEANEKPLRQTNIDENQNILENECWSGEKKPADILSTIKLDQFGKIRIQAKDGTKF